MLTIRNRENTVSAVFLTAGLVSFVLAAFVFDPSARTNDITVVGLFAENRQYKFPDNFFHDLGFCKFIEYFCHFQNRKTAGQAPLNSRKVKNHR